MRTFVWICVLGVGLASAARGQGYAGGGLILAQPTGEFSNYVDLGFGFAGHVVWMPTPRGSTGLRLDGSFIIYGSETRRYQLVPLINVDVTTNNVIAGFQIGPQVMAARGAIRPYAYGQIGFSYFATTSSVEGSANTEPFANSTNFDDFTFASSAGTGLLVVLSHARPVSLDLGARYLYNGRAQYLREGSITVTGNTVTYSPIESETNLIVYTIGVSVGLRRR